MPDAVRIINNGQNDKCFSGFSSSRRSPSPKAEGLIAYYRRDYKSESPIFMGGGPVMSASRHVMSGQFSKTHEVMQPSAFNYAAQNKDA